MLRIKTIASASASLLQARLRGYKWILAGQMLVMINFLFVIELLSSHQCRYWKEIMLGVTGGILLLMNYLTYVLVKELAASTMVRKFIVALLYVGVFLALVTGMEIVDRTTVLYRFLTIVSTCASLVSFIILFYLMTYDIFNEKHDINYRLLGSACIYLGIGATFGLLFCLLALIFPAEFGITGAPDIFAFIPCYNFSFYTLAGMEPPALNFTPLIKNIAVIESIVANLFIVMIVGRLLLK